MSFWILTHFTCTAFMTGLIWIIQIVHYPLFNQVGKDHFIEYEKLHTFKITWIVAPVMLLELSTAIFLLFKIDNSIFYINIILLIAIWLCTFFIQIPQHQKLARGFYPKTIKQLVQYNWIRTILWTVRTGLLFFLLAHTNTSHTY